MGTFNFWDVEIWSFVITIAVLIGAMLLANILRRKIPFLRRSLLPSAVLGGFIALIADSIYKKIAGTSMFQANTLEALTYHGLGLGLGLRGKAGGGARVTAGPKRPHLSVCPGPNFPLHLPSVGKRKQIVK